nr:glycosyltransferase family 4 protein [Microbacterium sp. CFBP 13617]
MARRALPAEVHRLTRSHPLREFSRLLSQRTPLRRIARGSNIHDSLHAIDRAVAARVRTGVAGVYGYEDAAAQSFSEAARAGIPRIYDLPIAYWREGTALLDEEASRQPEWADTLTHRRNADRAAWEERKERELGLATRIITASSFTRASLRSYPGELAPTAVIPYGAPAPSAPRPHRRDGRLRVLFVGGLSQRKGISYFFDALTPLSGAVDVTVVGLKVGESRALDRALRGGVSWIPTAPHARILELMRDSDVLVFPSLFEGFGLVLTEALSQGLPVIATPHTAAPDLITDGEEGWIVPIRSASAITERLELLLDDEPLGRKMSEAARERAMTLRWSSYAEAITQVVRDALQIEVSDTATVHVTEGTE